MNMNNSQQKQFIAPEMQVILICTERLCSTSQTTETATHENYETQDLFE